MQKHISFWIGVFSAILLGIPIAFGMIGAAEDRILDVASVLFGVVLVLIVLLVVLLFFKDRILSYFFGKIETSNQQLTNSLSELVTSIVKKDAEQAIRSSEDFTLQLVNWYSWANFYRWIVRTCIGMLALFATFVGTIILFEQIRSIEKQTSQFIAQNDLASMDLTSDIRARFFAKKTYPNGQSFAFKNQICTVKIDSGTQILEPAPNMSTVNSMIEVIEKSVWREKLISSMNTLLSDSSSRVVLGALLVLDQLGEIPNKTAFTFRDIALEQNEIEFEGDYYFWFENSIVESLTCKKCEMHFANSFVSENEALLQMLYNAYAEYDPEANYDLMSESLVLVQRPVAEDGETFVSVEEHLDNLGVYLKQQRKLNSGVLFVQESSVRNLVPKISVVFGNYNSHETNTEEERCMYFDRITGSNRFINVVRD